jgi:cell division protein FtsL
MLIADHLAVGLPVVKFKMKIMSNNTSKIKSLWSAVKDDEDQNEGLKSKILKLDDKLQQMLLWSNICTLWACILLIITIAKIYGNLTGKHPVLLACSLILITALLGMFLYAVWKSIAYKNLGFKKASKTYLNYQINKLSGQRKLISGYLLVYAIILTISSVFFYRDISNGLTVLFKATAPVSVIIYALGFYFMIAFTRQKRKLELLEKQVNHISFMEKVNQN